MKRGRPYWALSLRPIDHKRRLLKKRASFVIYRCEGSEPTLSKPNRFYSKKQEDAVALAIDGKRVPNSGAGPVDKGDVTGDDILIECKTLIQPQQQHTIRQEWLTKNTEEAFSRGKLLSALAFDFGHGPRYYILSELDFQRLYRVWLRDREENG